MKSFIGELAHPIFFALLLIFPLFLLDKYVEINIYYSIILKTITSIIVIAIAIKINDKSYSYFSETISMLKRRT